MIIGPISSWTRFIHTETQRTAEVRDPDVQVKLADDFVSSSSKWTTCVQYTMEDSPSSSFVVDVDSFRRKFERIES